MRPDQKFEVRVVALLRAYGYPDAVRTRASGALEFEKGDLKWCDPLHVECKHSVSGRVGLLYRHVHKAALEADHLGRLPVLAVGCGGGPWLPGHRLGFLFPALLLPGPGDLALADEDWGSAASRRLADFHTRCVRWHGELFRLQPLPPAPAEARSILDG
jgi:hypothetical protein